MFWSTVKKLYLIEFDTCNIRCTFSKKEVFFKEKNVTMLQTDLQLLFMWPFTTTASLISLEESQSTSNETQTPFRVNVNQF